MTTLSKRPDEISVRVLKYDGLECRRWNARVARREESLIILDAEFEFDVEHNLLGQIRHGTKTVEYYWLDRWYNVFQFLANDDRTRLWYCNINVPPTFDQNVLSYVDLDIDILVRPDFSYEVLDIEEFEINAERFGYSSETKEQAHRAVSDLISMIETRQFPFQQ